MPIGKPPLKPLPANYIPPGAPDRYKVQDGDDWGKVAALFKMDTQALIRFNFNTNDPAEVNWYLERNVGCKDKDKNGLNWKFSSRAQPGFIYFPRVPFQPILTTYTYSAATLSWIDPKMGLAEVDIPNKTYYLSRSAIIERGVSYRFANFLEATVDVLPTSTGPMPVTFGNLGFTDSSTMYRGPSYAGLPSEPFMDLQDSVGIGTGTRFRQIVGARTQSPEILAEQAFGGVVLEVTHLLPIFPPIWTEIELFIGYDGTWKPKLLRHSLFPSIVFYTLDTSDSDGSYVQQAEYDGMPNYKEWRNSGWGPIQDAKQTGPVPGNPWSIRERHMSGSSPGIPVTWPLDRSVKFPK
jgi:hypothetical protein